MAKHDNLYISNQAMIDSGTFWRCPHGYTQFTKKICWRCALARPWAFLKRMF